MVEELIRRLDFAIARADERAVADVSKRHRAFYAAVAGNLRHIREGLTDGTMLPVGSGNGLGVAKAIEDFGLRDAPIRKLVGEIEHIYRTGELPVTPAA